MERAEKGGEKMKRKLLVFALLLLLITTLIPTTISTILTTSAASPDTGWTLVTNARALKGYPNLAEYIWQKNASMAPNGPYDKIGLHRLVNSAVTPKGVIFINPGTYGNGEQLTSNPLSDNYTKTENDSIAIYWANRGFDVYAIDYRTHFVPITLNASQLGFMANWGWDQWISDIREAVTKVKQVSGVDKVFMVGFSFGGIATMNYATIYGKEDLQGIVLLDGGWTAKNQNYNSTNTINLTSTVSQINATGIWGYEYPNLPNFPPQPSGALFTTQFIVQNPNAPANIPGTNQSLPPPINPLTNKTWTNITEWYNVVQSGPFSNTLGGYGNVTVNLQNGAYNDRYWPKLIYAEMGAYKDWTNCPYVAQDFDDKYKDINVPLLGFSSELFGIPSFGNLTNGIGNTDFITKLLPEYGHLDVIQGPYSARDVSEPAYQWMVNHLPPTLFGNTAIGTVYDQNDANAQSISYFSCRKTGVVTDIMAYIDGASSGNCIAAIYAVNGGSAGALLAQSNPVSLGTSFSWVDFKLPTPYNVVAGTTYGLAVMGNVPVNVMEVDGTGQRDHNAVSSYAKGFANPFGLIWGTDDRGAMSIYATGINTSTLGNTNIGTYQDGNDANAKSASYFMCSYTGTVTDIFANVARVDAAGDGAAAIYADNGGSPGALIASTSEATVGTTFSWVDFHLLSPVSVTTGTGYWLAISSNNDLNLNIVAGSGVRVHNGVSNWFSDPFGPVWGADSTGAMSIYAS
jgi:pimeloyl-ACP methyl ester carboxylesterase